MLLFAACSPGGQGGPNDSPGGGGNAGTAPAAAAGFASGVAGERGIGGAGSGGTSSGGQAPDPGPAYLKASNTGAGDLFGVSVALSTDGSTLAVGANREASSATGVNGARADDAAPDAGAVYLFASSEGSWQQQAYLKASNTGSGDGFGSAVALSADGSTLAVGAPLEASAATGIDGDPSDDSAEESGAVYLFVRSAGSWEQQAYLKASNTHENAVFGVSVALSADGSLLAVGADGEDSSATGVDGDQTDRSAIEAGAVYVFERSSGSWRQAAYVKASNTDVLDHFGEAVALSADGRTLAVGASFEDGAGSSVDGDQQDDSATSAGAAYVFLHDGSTWQQQAYLKPFQNDGLGYDGFGSSVSLSADGNRVAIGAAGDDSAATGIDGDPNDAVPYSGAAYVFARGNAAWQPEAYLKASNASVGDEFGHHLHLAGDGEMLLVGASLEASAGSGINADAAGTAAESGAAYVFARDGTTWRQRAFIKAPNPNPGDRFGWSVASSAAGEVLAIGASREASGATGINGALDDNSAARAGAVYVYRSTLLPMEP